MISLIFSKVPPAHTKGNDIYQLKRKHLPANGENFLKKFDDCASKTIPQP